MLRAYFVFLQAAFCFFFMLPNMLRAEDQYTRHLDMVVRTYDATSANVAFNPRNFEEIEEPDMELWLVSFDRYGFAYLEENGNIYPERRNYQIDVWEGSGFPLRYTLAHVPRREAEEIQTLFDKGENRPLEIENIKPLSQVYCEWSSYGSQQDMAVINCDREGDVFSFFN